MASKAQKFKSVGKRPVRPDGVDKVTGRANFGADLRLPGMLVGKILRSPHAHARLLSVDTGKALALPGVKSVITSADLPDLSSEWVGDYRVETNFRNMSHNVLASGKVLYDGHAVAAVAATSEAIADQALSLIEVKYEVLPHVLDVEEAMRPDAPLLHDDLITRGLTPPPEMPSNIGKQFDVTVGDTKAGFKKADVVVERRFTTKPVHQGYIEPHAAIASTTEDGQTHIWCSTQGQFAVRGACAKLLGMDISQIKVTPAEIGGGFGGKIGVYLEPLAVLMSRKTGRPVKMVMTREECFRATGPASGSAMTVKVGATKDGKIIAAEATLAFQAGAYPGSPVMNGCMTGFAPYDIENVKVVGYDVVVNRPKSAAYRAPGAPIAAFAIESALDELAKRLDIAPLDLRRKNAAREGTQAAYGPRFGAIGYVETLEAAKAHPHYSAPLGPNQGRGIASGFWFNGAGQSSAAVNINEDGTAIIISGSPDIGGSRASMAMMAAEVLGINIEKVRPVVGDTDSIGFTNPTGGSRVTFATGKAVVEAANDVVGQLRARAAMIWEVDADGIVWEDGHAVPASTNVGEFEPLSLAQIAGMAAKTGGPISGRASINATGQGPGFGTHICDVEVDRETGRVTVLRYTVVQDAGRAIHPSYVEGQMQGGAAQGIGWALNEEYVYGDDGCLQNPGFLDYRMPVASDLPMIDTVIVEVPNPNHPFGVKGVGEVPIVPPMAAVANAVEDAIGVRMADLPMSPPRILAALS
jgi:CO/xanthine dehydrogenase Mo-binding subunit